MKEITGDEFYTMLISEDIAEIRDYKIDLYQARQINPSKIKTVNKIINCEFIGYLQFFEPIYKPRKSFHILEFHDCSFELINMVNCCFQKLLFKNIQKAGLYFSIKDSYINVFEIDTSTILNTEFTLDNNKFISQIHIKKLLLGDGKFNLWKNTFPQTENNFLRPGFINSCQFKICDFYDNDFGVDVAFVSNILKFENQSTDSFFKECKFGKISFNQTDFGDYAVFRDCVFRESAIFENIKNDINTTLDFKDCTFKGHTSFNKSKLNKLNFNHSTFEAATFFQDTYFDIIKLNNSIFEKNVFFDDVKIRQIDKCDRRTIRNIKLHLQKAENKIDYNKFRVYEFEAYKVDLKKAIQQYKDDQNYFYHRIREIKYLKRDLFILNITGFYSEYGTDWKRAAKCTILFGLIWYSVLYFSRFHGAFDIHEINNYFTGAFRFFLVTDFSSPFKDKGNYLDSALLWLPLILGKIIIAFGIYEMIQAFRKFKA